MSVLRPSMCAGHEPCTRMARGVCQSLCYQSYSVVYTGMQDMSRRGACLPACSIEEGQDDEGSQPPQDEEQVEEPEEEAGVAEHKQPREERRLPSCRLGEGCILLPPLQAPEVSSACASNSNRVGPAQLA